MIHDLVLNHIRDALIGALITDIPTDDPARVGVVKLGNLQGEPDPDDARIYLTLHENDPDEFDPQSLTGMRGDWHDVVEHVEIGGAITWRRRFTVKGRCLLELTKEGLAEARDIASTVRTRMENCLLDLSFSGVMAGGEYVSRPIVSEVLQGEMLQGGGPPDAYSYHIKFRFDVLTTRRV